MRKTLVEFMPRKTMLHWVCGLVHRGFGFFYLQFTFLFILLMIVGELEFWRMMVS